MHVCIIAPALPPQLDAIGHYSGLIAAELAPEVRVTVLTAAGASYDPIPDVAVSPAFTTARPGSFGAILHHLAADRPDWLLLQYNPFSYGRWGLNPLLPLVIRIARRREPKLRFALMVHEPFVPPLNWKFAVMTVWQRWQLWMLGHSADIVYVSIDPWARQLRPWFPRSPVVHLPVVSNLPHVPTSAALVRGSLGIPGDTHVVGLFGTAHPSRMLALTRETVRSVRETVGPALLLYMGPHGHVVRDALGSQPFCDCGALPAEEVSRRFAAMDVYLAPFVDGVSTRRGSLMAGLQHGVATVGTDGSLTDEMLRRENGRTFLLAPVCDPDLFAAHVRRLLADRALRERLGQEGQRFYEREFSCPRIASRLLVDLSQPLPTAGLLTPTR